MIASLSPGGPALISEASRREASLSLASRRGNLLA